jgi:hypothetical protein
MVMAVAACRHVDSTVFLDLIRAPTPAGRPRSTCEGNLRSLPGDPPLRRLRHSLPRTVWRLGWPVGTRTFRRGPVLSPSTWTLIDHQRRVHRIGRTFISGTLVDHGRAGPTRVRRSSRRNGSHAPRPDVRRYEPGPRCRRATSATTRGPREAPSWGGRGGGERPRRASAGCLCCFLDSPASRP